MRKHTRHFMIATAIAALAVMAGCSKPPEPVATAPVGAPVAGNVSDTDVSEHVKTALLQSEVLKGFDIGVVTLKGDVRLSGVLDNQAQIDEAVRVARASDGAHTIHDELTIKK